MSSVSGGTRAGADPDPPVGNGKRDPEEGRRRAGHLRLAVGVPVTLTFVALAAGIGAINLLVYLNPAADATRARFWATLVVVGFSLAAGGFGWWFVHVLQQPLEDLTRELEERLGEMRASLPHKDRLPVRRDRERETAGPVSPAEEVAAAHRTIEEYLAVLDEVRLDAALLEEMEQAVVGLDASGRILHANGRARAMLAGGDDLKGRSVDDLPGGGAANVELRAMVRRCLEEVDAAGPGDRRTVVTEELAVDVPDGGEVPVRARAHASPSGFSLAGIRADEGPVVLLTLQPADRAESREMLLERRDRLAALGTLVAEVAHEVRNPLGSLRSLAELIAHRLPEDDPKREGLEEVTDRVDRVVGYLDEVLDYAQPRRLEREEVTVASMVARARSAVEAEAASRGVELRTERGEEVPERISVDPDRLGQVLENLVRNGAEHADEGGRVTLRSERGPGGELVLEVHNTGSYIPEEERARIFRPFESGRAGGTGLGLTLSRYLVRLHGGRIEVESDRVAGTTFRVLLPAG